MFSNNKVGPFVYYMRRSGGGWWKTGIGKGCWRSKDGSVKKCKSKSVVPNGNVHDQKESSKKRNGG